VFALRSRVFVETPGFELQVFDLVNELLLYGILWWFELFELLSFGLYLVFYDLDLLIVVLKALFDFFLLLEKCFDVVLHCFVEMLLLLAADIVEIVWLYQLLELRCRLQQLIYRLMTYERALCFTRWPPSTFNFALPLLVRLDRRSENIALISFILKGIKSLILRLLCRLKLYWPIFGISFHRNFKLFVHVLAVGFFFKFGNYCGLLLDWLLERKLLHLILAWILKILFSIINVNSWIFLAIAPHVGAQMPLVYHMRIIFLISILKPGRNSLQAMIHLRLHALLPDFTAILSDYPIRIRIINCISFCLEMIYFCHLAIFCPIFLFFVHFTLFVFCFLFWIIQ